MTRDPRSEWDVVLEAADAFQRAFDDALLDLAVARIPNHRIRRAVAARDDFVNLRDATRAEASRP